MSDHLVSIIIPTYNRADLLGETLSSILSQTYNNWECLVIDDGSTDNTASLVNDYTVKDKRIKYYKRPVNYLQGGNGARNYGFKISKGAYINWFDSDDIMHPEKLETQLKLIKKHNSNFVTCQSIIFKESIDNTLQLNSDSIFSEKIFIDYLSKKISWLTQAPLWNRSFLNKLENLFDESLKAGQEWEFHSRVLLNYRDYIYTNKTLVYVRKHDDSISYSEEKAQLRQKNYVLARIKIINLLNINKDNTAHNYLYKYILTNYKRFLTNKDKEGAKLILKQFVLKNKNIKPVKKLRLFLAYYTYLYFGKGHVLLKESN